MKLAVFTSTYPARVATFFERDMRGLIAAGVSLDIFAVAPLDAQRWQYSLGILGEDVLPRRQVHHLGFGTSVLQLRPWPLERAAAFGREVRAITASAARFGLVPLLKTAYVVPKAWSWARDHAEGYDQVLAYWGNYAGTCAYLYHRLSGRSVPFSIWLHAGTDLYRTQVFLREKLLYADSILTCCAFNRTFLTEHYPDIAPALSAKTAVCYHGLDLAEFPYRAEGRPLATVLAVGALGRGKGFPYLLHAAKELARRGIAITVQFAGDGEERGLLERLARELGIADRVRFLGWLKFPDVRKAMSEATMLVHPSDGLGDGLPNVLREAMALGTPVVASDVAGIPEALDHGRCGVLVPPKDVGALADAIELLLQDPNRRRELAERGRRHTELKFDLWKNGAWLAQHLGALRRRGPDPKAALTPTAARC